MKESIISAATISGIHPSIMASVIKRAVLALSLNHLGNHPWCLSDNSIQERGCFSHECFSIVTCTLPFALITSPCFGCRFCLLFKSQPFGMNRAILFSQPTSFCVVFPKFLLKHNISFILSQIRIKIHLYICCYDKM